MQNPNQSIAQQIRGAQVIRIWDILFIGPVLILIGLRYDLPVSVKAILVLIGAGTILYNAYHFNQYRKQWK